MGRMFDALKQIESKPDEKPDDTPCDDNSSSPSPPEAELSFPDELLDDTAALLDEYERGELQTYALLDEIKRGESQTSTLLEENKRGESQTSTLLEEIKRGESQTSALLEENKRGESPRRSWPQDSRHTDLAANILSQIPVRGPVALLFAAPASTGVSAASLVPLFSALAEQAVERAGGRTLVVECDFRRAALAARFAVEPEAGLGDVLASRAQWRKAVCRTEQESLDVICARAARSAAANVDAEQTLASWARIEAILAAMREEYRLILLENVSAAGDEMSRLASLCHGAYLLIRAGQTPCRTARESVAELKSSGGKLLGCILLDP